MQDDPESSRELAPSTGLLPVDAFALSRFVLDDYTLRILTALHEKESTALDLSRRWGIPIVAAYRRLRRLELLGLVAVMRTVQDRNGHAIRLFRSRIRALRLILEDGRLRVRIELEPGGNDGPATIEQAVDAARIPRKRSRPLRDLGYAGAALELVPHRGEGALDPGETGG